MSTPDHTQGQPETTSAGQPETTSATRKERNRAAATRTRMQHVPNALTVLRIIMVPVFAVLLLMHGGQDPTLRWWALGVFLVAMFTDKLDGDIARKYNIVSNFGKLADPIADKALMAAAFIGLAIVGALPWWVPVVILVREIGITVMRMFMLKYEVMPASRGGKIKTVLQTVTVALYIAALPLAMVTPAGFMFVYAIIAGFALTLTVVVTVLTGVDYVLQAQKIKKEAGQSEAYANATNTSGATSKDAKPDVNPDANSTNTSGKAPNGH
ncbi:CDP-diacylglycerol--glycerol-3-phosphate 3-phosphatidyltransferase [Brevibacterium paucivorans]|uniref:CDP-diacylglycerol--glycerol-3-phosphate 3-phosphatidyltransferase n=1 Tax=Brevibacterium paucivorans TaxID=170994 RepID=UPI003219A066